MKIDMKFPLVIAEITLTSEDLSNITVCSSQREVQDLYFPSPLKGKHFRITIEATDVVEELEK